MASNATLQTFASPGQNYTTVVRDGFYAPGDGGAATYIWSSSPCTLNSSNGDNGTQVKPTGVTGCWNIQGVVPTDVRVWGAHCDVVALHLKSGASWKPLLGARGALIVDNTDFGTSRLPADGNVEHIAISQIGGPTLWAPSGGAAQPAVWATRFSQLGGTMANYKVGDLIAFQSGATSGNTGAFSQQIAIIVDASDSNGSITDWHYLWGGLYDPTQPMDGAFSQDSDHSFCANGCVHSGSGAAMRGAPRSRRRGPAGP